MNNKKRIVNLEYFREMLHICPRIPNQQFDELPFEEEILAFLIELDHNGEIKMITDVNINKLHQPWRSFAAVINKCLSGKITGYDKSYKEYYAIASGAEPPKTKASVRKKQSSSDTTITMPPPFDKGKRLKTSAKVDNPAKEKQPDKSSKAKGADKGTGIIARVPDVPTYESDDEEISWKSNDDDEETDSDNDGDDFVHPKFSTHDEEDKLDKSFDPIVRTPSHDEKTYGEDNDEDSDGMNVEGDKMDDEGANKEDDTDELYRDVNINLEGIDIQMADVQTTQVIKDTHVTLTLVNPEDVLVMTTAEPPLLSATTLPPPSIPIISHVQHTPAPSLANIPSSSLMNEAVKVVVQLQSDKLRNEAQAENEDFLNKLEENNHNIIKEQVRKQVKVQVSKILPKIKKTVNEQLEAEVLTRLPNSSKTSHAVAADLSELELKRILIDKIESNKSIHRSDEQKNLYKALVDAYEWSKSHQKTASESAPVEEPIHTTQDLEEPAHQEFETGATDDQPVEEASQHPHLFQKQAKSPTPDCAWNKTLPATRGSFVMNWLKVDTLTPKLLAGPTYELMKGSCKSLVELEFFLEEVYNNPEGQQYPHDLLKPLPLILNSRGRRAKAADYRHIKWIEDLVPHTMWSQVPVSYDKHALWGISHLGRKRQQFYRFAVNSESARDVYFKRRIIAVTKLQIVKWHNYKHLDWIIVRRDDDKLYKFKEGDFIRLCIQDIEDMMLLLAMKMEHYLSHTNYPIWKVIQNGNGLVSVTTYTNGMIKVLPPKTVEEVVARERERKARTTLLMALPENHLAKFHKMADAKEVWEAIKSRFCGNDESKKMQKYLLKQ
nr:xylulose kinase-1 [Tanacetum cinerariifolium]